MTNKELAILGLVAEGPGYGYQIEQVIEERGMRNWTEIGFSSIYYILNKLEKEGWLTSELQPEGSKPPRKVYRITTAGRHALQEAVRRRLAEPRPMSGDFPLALANLPVLTLDDTVLALESYHSYLVERLAQVTARWQADQDEWGLPQHVNALFDHSLTMLKAEHAWVTGYIDELQSAA